MTDPHERRWSLHITISMLLVGILVLVVGGAVAITLVVRSRSLKATAAAIQHEVSKGLAEKLIERLSPAEGILEAAAAGIRDGRPRDRRHVGARGRAGGTHPLRRPVREHRLPSSRRGRGRGLPAPGRHRAPAARGARQGRTAGW